VISQVSAREQDKLELVSETGLASVVLVEFRCVTLSVSELKLEQGPERVIDL